MLKIRFLWIAVTTLFIFASAPLAAAETGAPWYQFEIIIFERIAKGAGSTEAWPDDPGTPSSLDALRMRLTAPRTPDNQAEPVAYKTLPKSAWRLTGLEQHLRRSRNYRPHVHLAWRQQMVHPDRAQLLYLEMMDKPDAKNRVKDQPKLEGTIKVGVKRYLHFETDLLLRRLKLQQPSQTGMLPLSPSTQAYRLQSKRRMRSEKLHYLDHPVIGVLAFASKYQPPKPVEPEIAEPATTDQQTPLPEATQTDKTKMQATPEESQSNPAQ